MGEAPAIPIDSRRGADGFQEEINPTGKSVIWLSSPIRKNIFVHI
jgi:hypothetical protein